MIAMWGVGAGQLGQTGDLGAYAAQFNHLVGGANPQQGFFGMMQRGIVPGMAPYFGNLGYPVGGGSDMSSTPGVHQQQVLPSIALENSGWASFDIGCATPRSC